MLNNAFGLLYTSDDNMRLRELTLERTVASVPFGGRYRIIDFPMSNLVNSGVISVAVITQKNYSSLLDHVGSGDPWDLQRKTEGLMFLPPFANTENGYYRGTVDAFKAAQDFISHSPHRYCIYQDCNTVYNCNYIDMMDKHIKSNADITLMYTKSSPHSHLLDTSPDATRIKVDEDDRVIDIEIGSADPKYNNLYQGCMIIDKQLLSYLVDDAFSHGYWNFMRDVLQRKLDTLKVVAYEHTGYSARMFSIESFFLAHMDLFDKKIRDDLFDKENKIYTKVKDEVPALYKSSAVARNVMVADGCVIAGQIEHSVLGRDVHIHTGAIVKNCVIMQGCEIHENAYIENCILDKDAIVRHSKRLVGPENFPVVVRKGSVV